MVFENHSPHAIIDGNPGQFGVIYQPGEDGRGGVTVAIDGSSH
jgi:hypothetical protein